MKNNLILKNRFALAALIIFMLGTGPGWTQTQVVSSPTVNTTFNVSAFSGGDIISEETNFLTRSDPPDTQASDITFSSVTRYGMTVSWTIGDGTNRIVLINTSDSFADPTNGTDPVANAAYAGAGEQVVYNGNSNSVAVTGLYKATTYWFKVYEYNGTELNSLYCFSTGTNNPSSHSTIVPLTLCGTKTIGIDGDYTTISAAIADLNSNDLCGPLNLILTDSAYNVDETFPIVINYNYGASPVNTTVIKPATGVYPVITCTTYKSAIILNGADYVIIDGSNMESGNSKDLTIINDFTADVDTINRVFSFENNGARAASNSTVMNCIIMGAPSVKYSSGLYLNDDDAGNILNISISNNTIKNARIGIRIADATNGIISNNILGDETKPLTMGGIDVSYCDSILITCNEIFGEATGNLNEFQYGIYIGSVTSNSKITKNRIHDFYYAGAHGIACWGIYYLAEAATPTEISNNLIYNIRSDGDIVSGGPDYVNYIPSGISIVRGGNVHVYNNTINMTGNILGIGPSSNFEGNSACLVINTGVTNLHIKNNVFKNSMTTVSGTGTNKTFGVVSYSENVGSALMDHNDYYIDGLNPNVGYLSGDLPALADWQAASAKDANSVSADPGFISDSDLHPVNNFLNNKGIFIPIVTTDFVDSLRSNPPDIGAYEYSFLATVNTAAATDITSEEATLNGFVNANNESAEITFEYGVTEAYGSNIIWPSGPLNGSENTAISVSLTGLLQQTTYHFRINANTSAGIVSGADLTFATGALGIDALAASQFEAYPVPSNGEFKATMSSPKAEIFTIRVYNSFGSLEYEKKDIPVNGRTDQYIDMSNAPSGMYTVTFISGTDYVKRKMIIRHK